MIWLGSLFLASLYYGLTLCVWYGFSDLWLVITITVIAGFMLFGGIFAALILFRLSPPGLKRLAGAAVLFATGLAVSFLSIGVVHVIVHHTAAVLAGVALVLVSLGMVAKVLVDIIPAPPPPSFCPHLVMCPAGCPGQTDLGMCTCHSPQVFPPGASPCQSGAHHHKPGDP
jgi:hypothetical protein